ncbi:hypothetical protein [Nocardia altamirensis]|uniref:hypothetical protein n=1 Tax=Nocardia altamirensis TaxID=472158 RepID=UPI0008400C2D|nr:hypothetical protein [Nocardia altamirensis]
MTIARIAAIAAITFAGFAGAGLASAAPDPARLGPYEALSTCERQGNIGIENGEWGDYDCTGGPGAWFISPR